MPGEVIVQVFHENMYGVERVELLRGDAAYDYLKTQSRNQKEFEDNLSLCTVPPEWTYCETSTPKCPFQYNILLCAPLTFPPDAKPGEFVAQVYKRRGRDIVPDRILKAKSAIEFLQRITFSHPEEFDKCLKLCTVPFQGQYPPQPNFDMYNAQQMNPPFIQFDDPTDEAGKSPVKSLPSCVPYPFPPDAMPGEVIVQVFHENMYGVERVELLRGDAAYDYLKTHSCKQKDFEDNLSLCTVPPNWTYCAPPPQKYSLQYNTPLCVPLSFPPNAKPGEYVAQVYKRKGRNIVPDQIRRGKTAIEFLQRITLHHPEEFDKCLKLCTVPFQGQYPPQ